jgi:putative hydrolase of the HAD superfamily
VIAASRQELSGDHAPLQAVLFDYGHTLVDYTLPERWIYEAYREIRDVLKTEAKSELPGAEELVERVARQISERIEESYASDRLQELDVLALFKEALGSLGFTPSPELVRWVVETEHMAGARHLSASPETLETLRALQQMGLRIGIISNAHYLPYMMRRDWERLGIAPFIDAAIISSEVGIRKPHPAIFQQLLHELDVAPNAALFVGDRLYDDIGGAQNVGMRAVLTHEFRQEEVGSDTAVPDLVINRLPELLPYVQSLLGVTRIPTQQPHE